MSKALELADESVSIADRRLESDGYDWSIDADVQLRENAAELRRQHAEIEALRNALQTIATWDSHTIEFSVYYGSNGVRDFYRRIAIAATGEKA